MEIFSNGAPAAAFLLSEAAGERSRSLFIIPSGQGMVPHGTPLKLDGTKATTPADAAVILYAGVDATTVAAKATVIARDAEVHGELLNLPTGTSDADKELFAEALAHRGIIVRWTSRPAASDMDVSDAERGDDPTDA